MSFWLNVNRRNTAIYEPSGAAIKWQVLVQELPTMWNMVLGLFLLHKIKDENGQKPYCIIFGVTVHNVSIDITMFFTLFFFSYVFDIRHSWNVFYIQIMKVWKSNKFVPWFLHNLFWSHVDQTVALVHPKTQANAKEIIDSRGSEPVWINGGWMILQEKILKMMIL